MPHIYPNPNPNPNPNQDRRATARCMWLGRGYGSNGIRALGRGLRASAAARAWRASVALQRQVLGLVRAVTGGARSLQAQLQVELHVELQVGPQRELRGVGQIVVRALLGRDRVRASPGAARRDISRAIAPITDIDIVVIAFKQNSVSGCPISGGGVAARAANPAAPQPAATGAAIARRWLTVWTNPLRPWSKTAWCLPRTCLH